MNALGAPRKTIATDTSAKKPIAIPQLIDRDHKIGSPNAGVFSLAPTFFAAQSLYPINSEMFGIKKVTKTAPSINAH